MATLDVKAHRAFKDELYREFTRVVKALANPHRLELVDLLAQGERSVEELAGLTALSVANASQHLQTLRAARLVEARREGLYVYYRLAGEPVYRAWQAIRALGEERLAEVERVVRTYLEDRDALAPVTAAELLDRLHDDGLVILDVRPELEYRAGHIPGARSVPVGDLEGYLSELPPYREVVAYCRGPYCVYAHEAVRRLRAAGRRARRLEDGWPEWRLAGLPHENDARDGTLPEATTA
jgi:rhodanese-related sulfurtransferase/DNA-binding transcriptional ArsR family regulator